MACADGTSSISERRTIKDIFEESNQLLSKGGNITTCRSSSNCNSESSDVDQTNLEVGKDLYPNCDTSIWLRSCSEEVLEPIRGKVTGHIPKWLKGTLLRNGPGNFKVGDMSFQHLFDGSALLHNFAIEEGTVTYQSRFIQTKTYKRNMAAQRIVVTEFGTKAVPDPCQTIFQRVSALFTPGESMSDNSMISIYPFGDEMYTFTESPVIHQIDPTNLETLQRVNVSNHVGIVNHTSHPHIMKNGTVFNLGLTVTFTGPHYAIMKFPPVLTDEISGKQLSMFEQGSIEGTIPSRWPLHPAYMHTFGITEHYFVIVEQPLSVSVPAMVKSQILNEPMAANLQWYKDEQTEIHLMKRENGGKFRTFVTEAFFYLHIINSFEEDGHLVIDICCYKDPSMLDCMYVEALKLIKVGVRTHQKKTWSEDNVYPSEPIFVPSPDSKAEDDGVVLSALIWGKGLEKQVGMLILDATTWTELGRTTFTTPSPVPKCLHGWFSKTN